MSCCDDSKVIALPSGEQLCNKHFSEYFESKVFRTIRQYNLLDKQEQLGVALSGGKDSIVVLSLLKKLTEENPNITVTALLIDEGIHGYRNKTMETAKAFCENNNVPLHIFSYESEFGMPLDTMLQVMSIKPCSLCGVFRRYLLNKKSKELGFTKLATGHNLDDECQSILMNQFKNNMQASARLGPKVGIKENKQFVQRIKPLYLCSEKEVATYAFINNLLADFSECPNVAKSYRAQVRDMLNNFEMQFPGTKFAIVNSLLEILPELKERFKGAEINVCQECGEAAAKDICKACTFIRQLKNRSRTVLPIVH